MKFRKVISCVVAIGCIVMAAGAVMAQDEAAGISNSLSVAYASKYVWRGLVLNPEPVMQPSLTLTLPSGLSYNYWASYNLQNSSAGGDGQVVEADHTLNYPVKLGQFDGSVGYSYWSYPNTAAHSTSELSANVCFGGKFNPTVSVNYDVDQTKGAYYSLGASYACGLPFGRTAKDLGLSVKVGFGDGRHNEGNYGISRKSALTDVSVGASTEFALGEKFTLIPSITYSRILDSEIRDALADPDNFVIGAAVNSSF
ncbi:MAG: hypothetical protein NT018_10500 [Armatimonadetes bacterium]|nr:hypothetical protein [Armatimonadota bacterium]